MDIPSAPTVETSTFSDAESGVVLPSEPTPAALPADWITYAIWRMPRRFRGAQRVRREFSRYELGEAKKNYVPPRFLTIPDPEPPLLPKRHRQPPNTLILAAKAWYSEWRNRDWNAANDFFRASDIEADPTHPIVRQDENA